MEKEILDLRTYEDYVDLGKVNTKRYLMISELIDNSISSFDTKFGEGNWKEVLNINIKINNKIEEKEDFHGIKYFPNSSIVVEDNAFGIKKDKMADSLRLNKKNDDKKSKMNVHGRGLKQSAFYFGLGVQLISKSDADSKSYFVENKPVEMGIHKEVKYRAKLSDRKERGTKIVISPLRESHRFTQDRLQEVREALDYRYSRLIKSGKMNIEFEYLIDNAKDWDHFKISGAVDDIAKLREDFDYDMATRFEIVKVAKELVNKMKKDANENDPISMYGALADETSILLEKIIIGDLDDKFTWSQFIKINNDEKVLIKFWYLTTKKDPKSENSKKIKRGYSVKRGIRINEGDRAILHPPIIKNEVSTYLDPLPSSNRSGAVDNRFAGEVDISHISAQTTTDKSTFEFSTQEDKMRFDNQISVIFDVYEKFILQGRSSNKDSVAAKLTKDDENKLSSTIIAKFRDKVLDIGVSNKERTKLKALIKFDNEKYELNIKLVEKPNPNKIITVKVNDEKKVIDANWFNGHNIWKNINEEYKNFNVEAMIPIFIVLVFQELEFNKKIKLMKSLTKEDVDKIRPTSNINEVSKDVK